MTALHLAAEFGRARLAKLLLEHGADPRAGTVSRRTVFFGPEDKPFPFEPFEGETPLDWAVRHGHSKLIRLLGPNALDDLYWAASDGGGEPNCNPYDG